MKCYFRSTTPASNDECEVTNEKTGEKTKILCSFTISPSNNDEIENLLLSINATESENSTKHCSKTKFGCCPDWYTPAEDKNQKGCIKFKLGFFLT